MSNCEKYIKDFEMELNRLNVIIEEIDKNKKERKRNSKRINIFGGCVVAFLICLIIIF